MRLIPAISLLLAVSHCACAVRVQPGNELVQNSDTLTRFVALLVDFGVVGEDDIRVYQQHNPLSSRGARSDR